MCLIAPRCFHLHLYLFDLLLGGPQTPHFYDFGTFERVPSSQDNMSCFREARTFKTGHINKNEEEAPNIFNLIILRNLKMLKIKNVDNFQKDGHRTIMKTRLIKSRKSWIWDQYLPENMRWTFGNFLKPRSQGTKKARHQETKTQKPKTKKPRNRLYFQERESPAPLIIPTPTPASDHPLG